LTFVYLRNFWSACDHVLKHLSRIDELVIAENTDSQKVVCLPEALVAEKLRDKFFHFVAAQVCQPAFWSAAAAIPLPVI